MGMANIDAQLAEIARIKESLRIKNQSLANIDPKYQMNQAYIEKLNSEVATLNANLAKAQTSLNEVSAPQKVAPTRANTGTSIQNTPYDDDGNLNLGWEINPETGEPYRTGTNRLSQSQQIKPEEDAVVNQQTSTYGEENDPPNDNTVGDDSATPPGDDGSDPYVSNGDSTIAEDPFGYTPEEDTPGPTEQDVIDATDEPQLTKEDQAALEQEQADNRARLRQEENGQPFSSGKVVPLAPAKDWRVRMSIAPTLQALYNTASTGDILSPLKATGGVIFPYTPQIQTGYKANYEAGELVHTNYKNYFYKNSSVEDLTITAEFTAQDQAEAQYLLAVMHFFRSVTKMFYGQDKSPNAGTPPPLVFLSGFGAYQYDNHPILISGFNYTLPNDVDYIRTTSNGGYSSTTPGGTTSSGGLTGLASTASKFGLSGVSNILSGVNRLMSAGLNKGGSLNSEVGTIKGITNRFDTTYVPTKIQFSISAYPIISRRDMSQNFSVEKYAKGSIYRGSQRGGSGIW